MECTHAYLEKNIDYVLCNKEPKPNRLDRTALFHAVCPHQVHCPKQNCHKLTGNWVNCTKLSEGAQNATEEAKEEAVSVDGKAPKKRTRKATAAKSEE